MGLIHSPIDTLDVLRATDQLFDHIAQKVRNEWVFANAGQLLTGRNVFLTTVKDHFEYHGQEVKIQHEDPIDVDYYQLTTGGIARYTFSSRNRLTATGVNYYPDADLSGIPTSFVVNTTDKRKEIIQEPAERHMIHNVYDVVGITVEGIEKYSRPIKRPGVTPIGHGTTRPILQVIKSELDGSGQ